MTAQLSNFATLNWLMPLCHSQLLRLKASWQTLEQGEEVSGAQIDFADMASTYHELYGALEIAEVSVLAKLAEVLSQVSEQMAADALAPMTVPTAAFAHQTLQAELSQWVTTGTLRQQLVQQCRLALTRLLPLQLQEKLDTVTPTDAQDSLIAYQLQIPELSARTSLTTDQFARLLLGWRQAVNQLLLTNTNSKGTIGSLQKISSYLWRSSFDADLQGLWYVCSVWLDNLSNNDRPLPEHYVAILSALDQVIDAMVQAGQEVDVSLITSKMINEKLRSITVSSVMADVLIGVGILAHQDTEAEAILASLNKQPIVDQEFLPRILTQLEALILNLQNPAEAQSSLSQIRAQLLQRGWSQYDAAIEQINCDLEEGLQSADLFSQLHWQIERQLQELYTSILFAHETITDNIGQATAWLSAQGEGVTSELESPSVQTASIGEDSEQQPKTDDVRQLRVAVESIKSDFNNYLKQNHLETLPSPDDFSIVIETFSHLGLQSASTVSEELAALFARLNTLEKKALSWKLVNDIAESLAALELFLDYLAHGSVDQNIVEKVQEHIVAANRQLETYINDPEATIAQEQDLYPDSFASDNGAIEGLNTTAYGNVTRFDDSGEIAAIDNDQSIADEQQSAEDSLTLTPLEQHQDDSSIEIVPVTSELAANNDSASSSHLAVEEANDEAVNLQAVHSEALIAAREKLKEDDFDVDEEIRDIFIEEAEEVLEQLDSTLPEWQSAPQDLSVLTDIRRSYHTLKGSGRMVGAFSIGETAWAIENLLNRVLDNNVAVTDELVSFVSESTVKIAVMVEDFIHQRAPSVDIAETVLRADNLIKGQPIDQGLATLSQSAASLVDNEKVDEQLATDSMADYEEVAKHLQQSTLLDVDSATTELPEVLMPFIADADTIPQDADDTDPEIKEIFIEEAQEVLETITPIFATYQADLSDDALLTEVRRGFHTLKGSGRMVGAHYSAELAWAIENMLNRVLEHSVAPTAAMMQLVADVLASYPKLVTIFESATQDYPDNLPLWVACAHAYSKGLGDSFDYRDLDSHSSGSDQADTSSAEQQTTATETVEESANEAPNLVDQEIETQDTEADSAVSDLTLRSIHSVNEKISEAPELALPKSEEEQELFDIFIEEAKEQLEIIGQFVVTHEHDTEVEIEDEVVRAFHTLRGAAGAQSLTTVSEISATIEHNLGQLQQHDGVIGSQHLQALAKSVELIDSYLTTPTQNGEALLGSDCERQQCLESIHELLDEPENKESLPPSLSVAQLISVGIDDLLDAEWELESKLSNRDLDQVRGYAQTLTEQINQLMAATVASKQFQALLCALLSVYERLTAEPELSENNEVINTLLLGHAELTGLFDALAGSMSLKVDKAVIESLQLLFESEPNPNTGADYDQPTDKSVNTDVNADVDDAGADENTEAKFEVIETDEELLEIFLEEAQELDADINKAFTSWRAAPLDKEALKELQRHLHTIKGGARMAGIQSIGDLTHEAETVYEYFVEDKLEPTLGWINVMQGVQDTLSAQIDYVLANHQSFYADSLVESLKDFIIQGELPDDAKISMPIIQAPVEHEEESAAEAQPEEELSNESDSVYTAQYRLMRSESWDGNKPDADILKVFLEEAEAIQASSRQYLQAFYSNSSNIASLHALQQAMHTIKGGARMIPVKSIADLAHQMESVYEALASRKRPATKMVSQLLKACHVWLDTAVMVLSHRIAPTMPNQLITALEQFKASPDSLQKVTPDSLQSQLEVIEGYKAEQLANISHDISKMPSMTGGFGADETVADVGNEMIRISAGLIEQLINLSGEAAINRARIDMGMSSLTNSIEEMGMTVQRLADQLRRMDIELEAQILSQIDDDIILDNEDFDPLEMDQYSALNQLSKSLSESASDLLDIKTTLLDKTRDSESLLLQLSRTQTELQEGLMKSRMVPFSQLAPRLQRIVRQTANELNKSVELKIINADDELDRTILERITSPLEHMLRNAVDHGVELPSQRRSAGKAESGLIQIEVIREGSEVVIHLSDDGKGINVEAVREKAISQGLIDANDDSLSDVDVMQYIFNAGLTTTQKVTQISGRGVGMDVVLSEIRQLGGAVSVESEKGKGSRFTIRLPLTVAVSDALIVRAADRYYAIPLVQIERVVRVSPEVLHSYYQSNDATLKIGETDYRVRYLNEMLTGHSLNELVVQTNTSLPVIIIKSQTGQSLAMQVDEISGSRIEVVVKPLGRQLSHVPGISAATIMGDGSVMLILDMLALMRSIATPPAPAVKEVHIEQVKKTTNSRATVLVVDDSVTVRKVTSRLLERQGLDAVVAKDGVDAIEILQELTPDLILLDIEMPRMDGFEVATQVRHHSRLRTIPIIMITSRTGEKHRERAMEIGVNDYMGKPFQENELLSRIQALLGSHIGSQDGE